jgi:hypothetical protein
VLGVAVAEAPHAAFMLDSSSVMLCTPRFSVLGILGLQAVAAEYLILIKGWRELQNLHEPKALWP